MNPVRHCLAALPSALALVPPPPAPRPARWPLLILVGPPRGGTTLAYQMLARHLAIGYVTNLQAAFHGAPWSLAGVLRRVDPGRRIDLESTLGRTAGWWGPHEGARFWYRHFPESGTPSGPQLRRMQREIRAWIDRCCAPLLTKNVVHVLRMEAFARALPEARFISVERDPVAVARSLLRARTGLGVKRDGWFSLRPPGCAALTGAGEIDQVVGQVMLTRRAIARAGAKLGAGRMLSIRYEDLCRRPADALLAVARFAAAGDGPVALRGSPPIQPIRGQPMEAEIEAAIVAAVDAWKDRRG